MLKEKEDFFRKGMITLDVLIVIAAFFISVIIRKNLHILYTLDLIPRARVIIASPIIDIKDHVILFILIVPVWSMTLYLNGIYGSMRIRPIVEIIFVVLKSALFTAIAFAFFVFIFKLEYISRIFFLIFMMLSAFTVAAAKIGVSAAMRYLRSQGYNFRRILIVGTGKRAVQFMDKIKRHAEWGLRLAGIIDYEHKHVGSEISEIKVMGTLEDLSNILHNHTIDEVVFLVPRSQLNAIEHSLYLCETLGITTRVGADLFELKIAHARLTEFEDMPLITFETTAAKQWQLFIKRFMDVVLSAAAIIILSPVFLAAALLVKITSPGPALYMQKRVGLNGRRFVLFKFRSMRKGSHGKLKELETRNEMKGPVFKIKDDPRVTAVGKFLRKFSIDELPQLLNVFAGQMSLVGPRPPIPSEVAQYEPWQRRRLSMRPGITCIWQISGRNKISFDEWMRLDLQYIDEWSLWLDIKILFKTIPAVLTARGAY